MSEIQPAFRDIRRVQQKHRLGCELASVAMVLGLSYDDLASQYEFDDKNERPLKFIPELVLAENNIAWCRKYPSMGGEWPPAPFAELHLASVTHTEGVQMAHLVVMKADGTVLDPWDEQHTALSHYPKVWWVAGLSKLGEAA